MDHWSNLLFKLHLQRLASRFLRLQQRQHRFLLLHQTLQHILRRHFHRLLSGQQYYSISQLQHILVQHNELQGWRHR